MSLIIQAAKWADTAHRGQKRKFTGRPYVEHCGRVAARVTRHEHANEDMIVAAWLHDVLEDTDTTIEQNLGWSFTGGSMDYVRKLTNPSKQHPELSRAERKKMDREHLRECCPMVRMIKMADRTDNLIDALDHHGGQEGEEWLRQYVIESHALLGCLFIPYDPLTAELQEAIKAAQTALYMTYEQLKGLA